MAFKKKPKKVQCICYLDMGKYERILSTPIRKNLGLDRISRARSVNFNRI